MTNKPVKLTIVERKAHVGEYCPIYGSSSRKVCLRETVETDQYVLTVSEDDNTDGSMVVTRDDLKVLLALLGQLQLTESK